MKDDLLNKVTEPLLLTPVCTGTFSIWNNSNNKITLLVLLFPYFFLLFSFIIVSDSIIDLWCWRPSYFGLHSLAVNKHPFTAASSNRGGDSICQHSSKTILFYGAADTYHQAKPMWWNQQAGCRPTVNVPPINAGTDPSTATGEGVQTRAADTGCMSLGRKRIMLKWTALYSIICFPGCNMLCEMRQTQCRQLGTIYFFLSVSGASRRRTWSGDFLWVLQSPPTAQKTC